jgi:hypothetical protein
MEYFWGIFSVQLLETTPFFTLISDFTDGGE